MTTFEKDFPSLSKWFCKGKELHNPAERYYYEEYVTKYCLDKQKVKNAIKKKMQTAGMCRLMIQSILEELGINDDGGNS